MFIFTNKTVWSQKGCRSGFGTSEYSPEILWHLCDTEVTSTLSSVKQGGVHVRALQVLV